MNAADMKKLREPFPKELIGKLPKPTKKDNKKGKCKECGGWHGLPAVHLDYVGHAAVTDRLLSVDPLWTWRPLSRDASGAPFLTQNAGGLGNEPLGLWGELTISGVTKPAFGGGKNAKECISDLIRNGAMRFGVGLDLWSKEDLTVEDEYESVGAAPRDAQPSQADAGASASDGESEEQPPPTAKKTSKSKPLTTPQRKLLFARAREKGLGEGDLKLLVSEKTGKTSSKDLTKKDLDVLIKWLDEYEGESS